MPKAPQSQTGHVPRPLKRNEACHQCRRRKLKCDASRPCSTCVRSHRHAVTHSAPGTELPAEPDCTYDEYPPIASPITDGAINRYERLENRIKELEALLAQKDASGSPAPQSFVPPVFEVRDETRAFPSMSIIEFDWPPHLPRPDLLRNLVDLFFTYHPHARRLFHVPTFMTSLSFPCNHPKFPKASILHAICALGSFYTAAVTCPPIPNLNEVPPDEIFTMKYRRHEKRPDSFAEQQAELAKKCADRQLLVGEDVLEILRARVILSWFYYSHSKWVEVFFNSGQCMQLTSPLGVNVCPPFISISNVLRPPSLLPQATTVIEDEVRRNTFWLAYANDRAYGSGNGWALSFDDEDISQLLPICKEQFENGVLVPPNQRQWALSPNVLLTHEESHVDSFVLYIKATILLSRVKVFNLRYRARQFAGDSNVQSPLQNREYIMNHSDPRGSTAFVELDHITTSFRDSFPPLYRHPIMQDFVVDNHLYTACLLGPVASIILHDPHADIRRSGCISAARILAASRLILDLIYDVFSTSFDISLLDPLCSFCWFTGGRVLLRFLKAAIDGNNQEQISMFQAELDFVHAAIVQHGRRIPLAFRYAKMLSDLSLSFCNVSLGQRWDNVSISFPRLMPSPMNEQHLPNNVPPLTHDLYPDSLEANTGAGEFNSFASL